MFFCRQLLLFCLTTSNYPNQSELPFCQCKPKGLIFKFLSHTVLNNFLSIEFHCCYCCSAQLATGHVRLPSNMTKLLKYLSEFVLITVCYIVNPIREIVWPNKIQLQSELPAYFSLLFNWNCNIGLGTGFGFASKSQFKIWLKKIFSWR